MDGIFLKVNIVDHLVGPEDMLHHIQGRNLSKPLQMILDGGEEDGLNGLDDLFLDYTVGCIVSLEKSWFYLNRSVVTNFSCSISKLGW